MATHRPSRCPSRPSRSCTGWRDAERGGRVRFFLLFMRSHFRLPRCLRTGLTGLTRFFTNPCQICGVARELVPSSILTLKMAVSPVSPVIASVACDVRGERSVFPSGASRRKLSYTRWRSSLTRRKCLMCAHVILTRLTGLTRFLQTRATLMMATEPLPLPQLYTES